MTTVAKFFELHTATQLVRLCEYGASLTHWRVQPSGSVGGAIDVVLGFDTADEYVAAAHGDNCYIGGVCGRYAGRIRLGRFAVGDAQHQVDVNNGDNCLHGGSEGWDKRVWKGTQPSNGNGNAVTFELVSPNGDQGFPGTVEASVTYTLSDSEGLRMDFVVKAADASTPVNITSHAYFNLSGLKAKDALSTQVQVFADQYVPLDPDTLCPDAAKPLLPVQGTVNDFRSLRALAEDSADRSAFAGYDVSFAVRDWTPSNSSDGKLIAAAHCYEPTTKLAMDVFSTAPDVHLYTGYYLTGNLKAKEAHQSHAKTYGRFSGFCFELQQFPNAPNVPAYPNTIVHPGQTVHQTTVYKIYSK